MFYPCILIVTFLIDLKAYPTQFFSPLRRDFYTPVTDLKWFLFFFLLIMYLIVLEDFGYQSCLDFFDDACG